MKSKGPKHDPWGTPCFKGNWSERLPFTETCWNRSDRYDLNQASALSVIPKSDSRRPISLSWRIVSKAALKSNNTSKVTLVLSISRSPTCNYCVRTKTNSSSIEAHKPPVLFARRRSTLESFSKHHFMKLRQHFHALVYDRMKVFQNYFLSSARKKVNKKKKEKKKELDF